MSVSIATWRRAIDVLFIGITAFLPHAIQAAELTWTGNGGVFFDDPANWNPLQSPTAADNLTFDASASVFDLNVVGNQSANLISFLGGTYAMIGGSSSSFATDDALIDGATLTASGANTEWTPEDLVIGDLTTGTMNVESNASVLQNTGLFLGRSALGIGTLNLSGANSQLGTPSSIGRVGVSGMGTLNISGGARADFSSNLIGDFVGSTGNVSVTGANSEMVTNNFDTRVGDEGTGFLNVSNGGRAMTTGLGNLTAGHSAGGAGTITANAGVIDVGNRISVGRAGVGTFNASNGTTVNSALQFSLGEIAGGVGTATFDNSTLTIENALNDLVVGLQGQGQLTLDNGSIATIPDDVIIGATSDSTGDNRLVITGGSTLQHTNTPTIENGIIVGSGGNGSLILNGGSQLTSRGLSTAIATNATGVVSVDGAGTNLNLGVLTVSNSGTSTMDVTGGAQVNLNTTENLASNLFVGDDTTAVGTLNISGSDGMGTASAVIANKQAEIGGSLNEVGGTGTVNITNGGRLSTVGAKLGVKDNNDAGAGGTGTVNISDAGSIWESSAEVIVGDNGEGHLNISGGGQADFVANLRVGNQNTADDGPASIAVSGSGSALTVQGELSLGDDRAATMTISDGAVVTSGAGGSGEGAIGNSSAADGAVVTVDNATWNHNGSRIKVGADGGSASLPSTLRVINGGQVTATGPIMVSDDSAGSHGLIEVSGAGSTVTAEGDFSVIGDVGTGTLNVTHGGTYNVLNNVANNFDVSGSGTGIVSVTGLGSTINVGGQMSVGRSNNSTGTLTVTDGGTVNAGNVGIARDAGSTGTVNLDIGGTLTVNAGSMLTVGGNAGAAGGNGTLNVQGGIVDVSSDQVAVTSTGTLNVSAGTLRLSTLTRSTGSQLNFTGGTLSMSGNQILDAASLEDIFNGNPTLSSGMALEVTGEASLATPLRLNGGRFSVGSTTNLQNLDWDSGTFALTATDLNVTSNGLFGDELYLNPGQNLEVTQQITNDGLIASGGMISVGSLQNHGDLVLLNTSINGSVSSPAGSTITVVGPVDFNGNVGGSANFFGPGTANFNASYDPGDSPAIVAFEGNVQFGSTGLLAIELGGTDTSDFDQLMIDGAALLDGTLEVSLVDTGTGVYAPQLGDSFSIVTASGGIAGTFANLDLPSLGGGLDWQLTNGGSTYLLNVITGSSIDGDFDNDGDLDGADIDALVVQLAGLTGDTAFDLTGDGLLNQADLQEWLALGGAANLPSGNSYLVGDANLDGAVNGQDFVAWNGNKFTSTAAWTGGDFNADGNVNGQDFVLWNGNKFQSADEFASAVPEPKTGLGLLLVVAMLANSAGRRD